MLDTLLYIKDGKIHSTIYYKPTDGHAYLRYGSEHPKSLKKSIPYSQFLRLRRIISEEDTFLDKANEMAEFFINRDYPRRIVQEGLRKALNISRDEALAPKSTTTPKTDILTFPITFNTLNRKVTSAVLKRYGTLQNDPLIGPAFVIKPTIAYRRGPTIGKAVTNTRIRHIIDDLRGTFNCNASRCLTCAHTNNDPIIVGSKGCAVAEGHFTCKTKNLVYAISCLVCASIYIGETGQELKARFRTHRNDVKNYHKRVKEGKRNSLVAQHFAEPGHTEMDMLVAGICIIPDKKKRLTREQQIILETGSYRGEGMNVDFKFMYCVSDNL